MNDEAMEEYCESNPWLSILTDGSERPSLPEAAIVGGSLSEGGSEVWCVLAVQILLGVGSGVVRELKIPMNPPSTSEFGFNDSSPCPTPSSISAKPSPASF